MNNIDKKVCYLYSLYQKKQASEEELAELFELLDALDNEQLTYLMQTAWDDVTDDVLFEPAKSKTILSNILSTQSGDNVAVSINPPPFFDWRKIAASVIVVLCIGAYFVKKNMQGNSIAAAKTQLVHDALPGNNKAILTLSNGSNVVLDDAGKGVVARQGNVSITKNKFGQVKYSSIGAKANNVIAYNTITTPRGGQYQVVLPDGSQVWLNAASSIKFPTAFTGTERRVEITGEAYFEVAKNPAMPFIVKTYRQEVKVLGTHFNIMAYNDERALKTTLIEGSIMLTSGGYAHVLKPGDQSVLNDQGAVKIMPDADVDGAIAWKNGLFQFKDEYIQNILRQAARWYDVEVSYQGKVPVRQFTGKISRQVKLSALLNMFKYAGLNFTIEGKKITIIN